MAAEAEAAVRSFIALWPDAATRARLAGLAREAAHTCGGRVMPASNLHLTVVFIGGLRASQRPAVESAIEAAGLPAAELVFDRLEAFAAKRIVYAAPVAVAPGFAAAQRALAQQLRDLGHPIETREFRPHVTLVRNAVRDRIAQATVALESPFDWHADELALVHSLPGERGPVYRPVRRWQLQRASTTRPGVA